MVIAQSAGAGEQVIGLPNGIFVGAALDGYVHFLKALGALDCCGHVVGFDRVHLILDEGALRFAEVGQYFVGIDVLLLFRVSLALLDGVGGGIAIAGS